MVKIDFSFVMFYDANITNHKINNALGLFSAVISPNADPAII